LRSPSWVVVSQRGQFSLSMGSPRKLSPANSLDTVVTASQGTLAVHQGKTLPATALQSPKLCTRERSPVSPSLGKRSLQGATAKHPALGMPSVDSCRSVSPMTPARTAGAPLAATSLPDNHVSARSSLKRAPASAPELSSRGSFRATAAPPSPTSETRGFRQAVAAPFLRHSSTPEARDSLASGRPSLEPAAVHKKLTGSVHKSSGVAEPTARGGTAGRLTAQLAQQREAFAQQFSQLERNNKTRQQEPHGFAPQRSYKDTAETHDQICEAMEPPLDDPVILYMPTHDNKPTSAGSSFVCETKSSFKTDGVVAALRCALEDVLRDLTMSREVIASQEATIVELQRENVELKSALEHAPRSPRPRSALRVRIQCDGNEVPASSLSRSLAKEECEDDGAEAAGSFVTESLPDCQGQAPVTLSASAQDFQFGSSGLALSEEPDDVDTLLMQFLSDHPGYNATVSKVRKGWYQFERPMEKKVFLKTADKDTLVVRVGQGYISLAQYMAGLSAALLAERQG